MPGIDEYYPRHNKSNNLTSCLCFIHFSPNPPPKNETFLPTLDTADQKVFLSGRFLVRSGKAFFPSMIVQNMIFETSKAEGTRSIRKFFISLIDSASSTSILGRYKNPFRGSLAINPKSKACGNEAGAVPCFVDSLLIATINLVISLVTFR